MNMNEYVKLLSEFGIDVEKEMALYEKALKETQGQTHVFCSGAGLRVLRHEKDNKLLNYGESFNFENGLKSLFKDFHRGIGKHQNRETEHLRGTSNISSPIDQWIMSGNTVDIKTEKGNSGFVIGAGDYNANRGKKQLLEVNAKKLITAFEWFNQEMPELKQLSESRMAEIMMGGNGSVSLEPSYTVRYDVKDDMAMVKGIKNTQRDFKSF